MYSEYLLELIDAKLDNVGRCSNMIWMLFTKKHQIYCLHVQCPCRICKDNSILLASGDMYYPSSKFIDSMEVFYWDKAGENLYDEKCKVLLEQDSFVVSQLNITPINDIIITFTNGIIFSTFSNDSIDEEQWRYFLKGSEREHLVARPTHIALE